MIREAIQSITTQQDYWWFCTLLLWVAAGAAFLAARKKTVGTSGEWWAALTLVGGFGIAITELVAHVLTRASPDEEYVGRDFLLFALQYLQAAAPIGLLTLGAARRFRMLAVVLGIVLAVTVVRRFGYYPWDLLAHASTIGLGVWAIRRMAANRWDRLSWAVVLVNTAFLVSTTGLFSEILHQQIRFVELSALTAPSAAVQAALALLWTLQLLPEGFVAQLRSGGSGRRTTAGLVLALALWLSAGFVIAWATGRTARRAFEDSLLARVQACTALVHPEGLETILQPAFKVEKLETTPQPNGRQSLVARSSYLPAAGRQTRHDLVRIQQANPDIYWAYFMTLRGGLLASAALPDTLPALKDVMAVSRVATERDLIDWAEKRSYVEGPLLTDYDDVLRAAAPLTNRTGAMCGWLIFETGAASWSRVQAVARFQAFALIGVGSGLMLLMLVLRQRTAAQEESRRQALAAAAADQAKSVFLAKVSHELRTPVQSLLGYAELLHDHADSPRRTQWLQAINSQSRLLLRLVNDLIDLSALQSGSFPLVAQPGRIAELVRQAVDAFEPAARTKGLELAAEFPNEPPPWLLLDETRLRQVVLNLVGNAVKFTSRGSVRVRLQSAGGPATDGLATLVLVVQDTGPGLAPEQQARLFRPFQRLDRDVGVEGAGLGLALSRALCERMGGSLTVESDGCSGTTFTAIWRLAPCPPPPSPEPALFADRLAGVRALVVDDNPLVAEYYLWVLRAAGAWCDRAVNGSEAVALAGSSRYDVVLMDLSMPGLTGFEATQRILAAGGKPPRIIGLSAQVQVEDREQGKRAGMDLLLLKPVSSRELLAAVARSAPMESLLPADDLALVRRLRTLCRQELPGLRAEIAAALAADDFPRLRERIHYLKNSADISRYAALGALCARVEAVPAPEAPGLQTAVNDLLAFLERALAEDADSLFRSSPEN